jgi:hypothetical protein
LRGRGRGSGFFRSHSSFIIVAPVPVPVVVAAAVANELDVFRVLIWNPSSSFPAGPPSEFFLLIDFAVVVSVETVVFAFLSKAATSVEVNVDDGWTGEEADDDDGETVSTLRLLPLVRVAVVVVVVVAVVVVVTATPSLSAAAAGGGGGASSLSLASKTRPRFFSEMISSSDDPSTVTTQRHAGPLTLSL